MTDRQQLARGKNVMLSLLEKRLSVPRIYLDATWQGKNVDILAIDRDGSGDVHVVLAYLRPLHEDLPDTIKDRTELHNALGRLADIQAQFKYVLGVASSARWNSFGSSPVGEFAEGTFAPDGLGRVAIAFAAPDDTGLMIVKVALFPERFRAFVGTSADEFVKKHSADWQIRA